MKSLISYVVTKTKVINGKYHRFLDRHFPRFYVLYTIFMKGKDKTKIKIHWISSWAVSGRISKIISGSAWGCEPVCLVFHKCLSIKLLLTS